MLEKTKKWVEDHKEGLKFAGKMIGSAAICVAGGLIGVGVCRKYEPFGKLSREGIDPVVGEKILNAVRLSDGHVFGCDDSDGKALSDAVQHLLEFGKTIPWSDKTECTSLIAFMREK